MDMAKMVCDIFNMPYNDVSDEYINQALDEVAETENELLSPVSRQELGERLKKGGCHG